MQLYRHKDSEKYLFLFTLSFIISVFAIRLFLELTGYFQLGNDVLHIAHVLWGGLAMLVGGILLIVYQGERTLSIGAILMGIGFGFFIDEVGKFITNDNNYFFAPAAAIIYTFMVISFLITFYFQRQKKVKTKEEMIFVLEEMKDIVSGTFHVNQKQEIMERLNYLKNNAAEKDIKNLAENIDKLVRDEDFKFKEPPKFSLDSYFFKAEKSVQNFFNKSKVAEVTLPYYLLIRGLTSLSSIIFLNYNYFILRETVGTELSPIYFGSAQWILVLYTILNFVYIFLLLYSFYLLKTNLLKGLKLARTTQLFSIMLLNVFTFYFEQFSAATEVMFDIISIYLINIILKKRNRVVT